MCGISGFYSKNFQFKSDIITQNFLKKINHRGPDSGGQFNDKHLNFSLGMRRLEIVDSSGGIQPMYSNDSRYVLVFNGEIINAPQLRVELEEKKVNSFQ